MAAPLQAPAVRCGLRRRRGVLLDLVVQISRWIRRWRWGHQVCPRAARGAIASTVASAKAAIKLERCAIPASPTPSCVHHLSATSIAYCRPHGLDPNQELRWAAPKARSSQHFGAFLVLQSAVSAMGAGSGRADVASCAPEVSPRGDLDPVALATLGLCHQGLVINGKKVRRLMREHELPPRQNARCAWIDVL